MVEVGAVIKPDMTASNDGDFLLTQSAATGRWHWSWLRGGMRAKCRVEGLYSYRTKQGALAAGRAAKQRLIRYCGEIK